MASASHLPPANLLPFPGQASRTPRSSGASLRRLSASKTNSINSTPPNTPQMLWRACRRMMDRLFTRNRPEADVVVAGLTPMLRSIEPVAFDQLVLEARRMLLSDHVLGITTTRQLRERNEAAVLIIGRDRFTRADLGRVECWNFGAAARLSHAIRLLVVRDTKDLYHRYPPSALAVPGIGAISLAVLGAAFECKKVGGRGHEGPLRAWVQHHDKPNHPSPLVTFNTMKRHEAADKRAEKKQRRHQARVTSLKEHRLATAASR